MLLLLKPQANSSRQQLLMLPAPLPSLLGTLLSLKETLPTTALCKQPKRKSSCTHK
jgi:hypothetical protein